MAYGISFETANGNVQIDSDTTNTGLIVLSSSASATSIQNFDPQKELVFAKPSSTSYATQKLALRAPANYTYGQTGTFTFEDNTGSSVNTNYVRAKWSNEQTASTSSYGVRVFNSDGDLAFDSGLYTGAGGIGIISYAAQQTLSGYGQTSTTSRMSTDTDKYYSLNGSYAFGNTTTFLGLDFVKTATYSAGVGVYWHAKIDLGGSMFGGTIIIANFTPRFVAEGGSV
tara:strand:+ start:439 stop:1119 length:681 start_codon:yes stop_codon:yes gene_type:complete